jgi:SMC interacting uncharacterized protein involved in chromosome segregation
MEPKQIYDKLLEELKDGELSEIQRQVFQLLQEFPEGLSRQDLVLKICGYWPESLDGNTDDRKIRKAIERLRQRLFPIISTSGKPGYRLDVSRDAVRGMINELRSRKAHLEKQIEAALKFYEIPATYAVDPSEIKQGQLI